MRSRRGERLSQEIDAEGKAQWVVVALAFGAAIGMLLGIGLYDRFFRRDQRIDLYFEDGSMVSIAGGSPEAAVVIPYAREALRAAR